MRPAHAFHYAFVRLGVPGFFSTRKLPDFDDTVAAPTGEALEGERVCGHGVDAVDMTVTKLGNEGGGEHAVELGGIEGSGIFSCSFEGVERWVEISGLAGKIRARGLVRRCGSGESFDFLIMSVYTEIRLARASHHLVVSP